MNDEQIMTIALDLARRAVENGNEPFGALLVKNGEIVATTENKIHSHSNPTHHAELLLISEYCMKHHVMDLADITLYTSCEPCFMCSGATVWTSLKRLVYSAGSCDLNRILGEPEVSSSEIVYLNSHHQPEVTKNILNAEGIEILQSYFGTK